MNTLFCWKERSMDILNKCFRENKKSSLGDECCLSEDEDDDDIYVGDNSIFERSAHIRRTSLKLFPERDDRLQRWRELTNIFVKPPSRRHSCFDNVSTVKLADSERFYKKLAASLLLDLPGNLEHRKNTTDCGHLTLTIKFQYLIMTERLKVTVVKLTNLFNVAASDIDGESRNRLSANVAVCLMPGKREQQTTPLREGHENPVFNTVMYFTGFCLEDILHMNLRLRVNGRNFGRHALRKLGESTISLKDFDIISETVLEQLISTR